MHPYFCFHPSKRLISPILRKGDYIYGSFVKPELTNGFINDSNPGDRTDRIGRFPFSLNNVTEALGYAKAALAQWRNNDLDARISAVQRFRNQLEESTNNLLHILTREVGFPTWEAHQEIKETLYFLDALLHTCPRFLATEGAGDTHSQLKRVPLGTVAIITPYSLPLLTPTIFTASALLVGNTVVHNPSKYTPGVGQAFAELWDRCQLPRGIYNMVQGPGSHVGQGLYTNDDVDGLLFAGSPSVAAEIAKKTPPSLPTIFHLGGKSMALVLEDADIGLATREILSSACRATGQRPGAIARVFAPSSIMEQLTHRLARSLDQITVGYGTERGVYIGPLVSEHWRTRYHRFGRSLLANGHTPIRSTENVETPRKGFYVRPAIYRIHWGNGAPALEDEPPGPMLLLYEVNTPEEMIRLHNRCAIRRMTTVYTNNKNPLLPGFLSQLDTGAIFVNRAPQELALPFSPRGKGSNGHTLGTGLLDSLTQRRLIYRGE